MFDKKMKPITRILSVLLIVIIALTAVPASPAAADSQAKLSASASSMGAGAVWNNRTNISADDDQYVVANIMDNGSSTRLQVTNFDFNIPTDATIDGVQVTIGRLANSDDCIQDSAVQLVRLNTLIGTPKTPLGTWTTTETAATYGSISDKWGVSSLAPSQINASDFGVSITAKHNGLGTSSVQAQVDYVQVTIIYNSAATTTTVSSVTSVYGNTPSLSATMTPAVSGKSIAFTLNNLAACTGTTDASGVATCTSAIAVTQNVGSYANMVKATFAGDADYKASSGSSTLTVTARPITVTAVEDTKIYDGTTDPSDLTVKPEITGSLAQGDSAAWTQTFDNKNAGTGKTLAPAGVVNDGNDGKNYFVTFTSVTTGEITARPISVTAATDSKPYDGTTASTGVPTVTNGTLVTGESAAWTQSFDSKHVGEEKVLTPAGVVDDGNDGKNYAVTFKTATGEITARQITVTAVTDSKVYNGTTTSTIKPNLTGNLVEGDSAAWTQSFDNKNAGIGKTIIPTGVVDDDNDGKNYNVAFVPVETGEITKLAITVTAKAIEKPYGSIDPELTYAVDPALAAGDYITGALERETGATPDTYAITQGSLSAGENYDLTFVGADFTIIKADQRITITNPAPASAVEKSTFEVAANSTSTLPVDYNASGACTNEGPVFTMKSGTGVCEVHFNQAGDTNYNAATEVVITVQATEIIWFKIFLSIISSMK